jgi:hypothetical protein
VRTWVKTYYRSIGYEKIGKARLREERRDCERVDGCGRGRQCLTQRIVAPKTKVGEKKMHKNTSCIDCREKDKELINHTCM